MQGSSSEIIMVYKLNHENESSVLFSNIAIQHEKILNEIHSWSKANKCHVSIVTKKLTGMS